MMIKRLWWIMIAVMISFMMYDTAFAGAWEEDDRGWRWKQDDGTYAAGIWEWLDGNQDGVAECYCFDADGYLLRLTKTPDGYYVDRNGAWVEKSEVQTREVERYFAAGWHTVDGKEYYFSPDNILWRDRMTPDNYYVDADGVKVTDDESDSTDKADGDYTSSGESAKSEEPPEEDGTQKEVRSEPGNQSERSTPEEQPEPPGTWEWLDENGDGIAECYYFDATGTLLKLTRTPDGSYVNKNGAWVENGVVQTRTVARNFAAGWHTLDGKEYYFYPANILWRNRITPDNHYVDADGAKVTDSEIDPDEMKKLSKNCRYIVFDKSSHFVELWQFGEKTHSFLATSSLVQGDKEVEGDWKTPEGEFYVCKMVPYSSYHLGIGVSYPSLEDAERGLAQGLITQSEYNALVNANKNGTMPNWYTRLGGEIEFHGNRQPTDCTRGCIGMRNEDIEILYLQVGVGDKIRIQP